MNKKQLKTFHKALNQWYQTHGRHDLPWRKTADPYAILVSEMMLQQTQVKTVLERFYHPFLHRFPTLASLAIASSDEVMQQWQGLGYYRRARYLHAAAKQSTPKLPQDYDGLIALPGVGKNTAHALLALAYQQPYSVMEANVKRVLCRIFALRKPTEKELWEHAATLLDRQQPFDYNQAMMDLGSMLCTPKRPQCRACPARSACAGQSSPETFPEPRQQKAIPTRQQQVLIIEDSQGRVYATPRDGEFLHGLYQFVELEPDESTINLNGQECPHHTWEPLGIITQVYSHFKQESHLFRLVYTGAHLSRHWHTQKQLAALPLSNKEVKIRELLCI